MLSRQAIAQRGIRGRDPRVTLSGLVGAVGC